MKHKTETKYICKKKTCFNYFKEIKPTVSICSHCGENTSVATISELSEVYARSFY